MYHRAGCRDVLYSAVPSLLLSPRYPASASHLVYGPFLAARLHRNLRHQRQQLAVDIGHSYSQWTVGEEEDELRLIIILVDGALS